MSSVSRASAEADATEASSAVAADATATIAVRLGGVTREILYAAGDTLLQAARNARRSNAADRLSPQAM